MTLSPADLTWYMVWFCILRLACHCHDAIVVCVTMGWGLVQRVFEDWCSAQLRRPIVIHVSM